MQQITLTVDELSALLLSASRKGFAQGNRPAGDRKMDVIKANCQHIAEGMLITHKAGRHELPST